MSFYTNACFCIKKIYRGRMAAYDDFMIFIGVVGNFFLYFQAYSLFQQRHKLTWKEEGAYMRVISYTWSCTCFVFWIVYAVLNSLSVVLVSTVIGLAGSSSCIGIISFYSFVNNAVDNPFNEFLIPSQDDAL